MGQQIFQEVTWNGVTVDTYTDKVTGRIQVFSQGFGPLGGIGGVLIAESVPANGSSPWRLADGERYRRLINNQRDKNGQAPLSSQEFSTQFFSGGARQLNNERAYLLNYNVGRVDHLKGFFENRIPFTVNPEGKKERVNFDGSVTTQQVVNPTAEPDDQPDPDPSATGAVPTANGNGNGNGTGNGNNTGTDPNGTGNGGVLPGDAGGTTVVQNEDGSTTITVSSTTQNTNQTALNGNSKVGGGKGELIVYPAISPPPGLEYDYVTFTAYEYSVIGDKLIRTGDYVHGGTEYESIQLPIQPSISETNAVVWNKDTLNEVQAAFANLSAGGQVAIGGGGAAQFQKAVDEGKKMINDALTDPTTRTAMLAYFAGQAVSANLIQRATGAIINPNLELLFNGPTLRTFNFTFRLTPRNDEESIRIRKLIRAFKRNSGVQRDGNSLFLKSPRVFQITYNHRGKGQHPYLNKIKPCALTNFGVNYTPDGSYMVFNSTGSLTSYDIQLSFTEINPVYANDIGESETDMGF